jgi:mono/diheme cytochrome c family protein
MARLCRFVGLGYLVAALLWPLSIRADELASQAGEAEPQDGESAYRPGLVATYTGPNGIPRARVEDEVAFAWGTNPPDPRLVPGPFTAELSGHVEARADGAYRLRVFAVGRVTLTLDGKTLIDARSSQPAWMDASAVDLQFGYYPLKITYQRTTEPARLSLFWEGPGFQLEPVSGRALMHDAAKTPADSFARGERLVRALGCAACHEMADDMLERASLVSLAGNISRDWLIDWLAGTKQVSPTSNPSSRRMPHFGFDGIDAAAIADFLLSASEEVTAPDPILPAAMRVESDKKKKKKGEPELPAPEPSAELGATLFASVGCLGCHRVGELGSDSLFGGGDLSAVAAKRPPDFFARWLANPGGINSNHRMPIFRLDAVEIESLSKYLATLGAPLQKQRTSSDHNNAARGRELVTRAGCSECHALASKAHVERRTKKLPLAARALAEVDGTCLDSPDPASSRPGYRLNKEDRKAIAIYLAEQPSSGPVATKPSGRRVLEERNCLGCHARGSAAGLRPHLAAVADEHGNLRDLTSALAPPSLTGVGDKLKDAALAAAISVAEPPHETWLRVRMPRFSFAHGEAESLVQHLIDGDRIPPDDRAPAVDEHEVSDAALHAAGPRLVTADGFGCTSCHAIGKWTPPKVALNAQGADLSNIAHRVRRSWFDRWLRNPARIVPQMEMPAVQQSIRGVLDGNLDRQLAAVWQVLNEPGFTPPSPSALRVVRRANLPESPERAAVITDLMQVGDVPFVKPLAIGLSNRHNLLFDLATNRMAGWWAGDLARQTTRGKSWHWEAGLPQLLPRLKRDARLVSELALVRGDERYAPQPDGDYVSSYDWLEHAQTGVRFGQRLHFVRDGARQTASIEQEFSPLTAGKNSSAGFRRIYRINNVPATYEAELLVLPGGSVAADGRMATLAGPAGQLAVHVVEPVGARLVSTPHGAAVRLDPAATGPRKLVFEYRAALAVDQFPPLPTVDRTLTREVLNVVPGFVAERLPVTDEAMPTGLAWRPDGTLALTSLEGRVWLAHDTNGDGLEDRLTPFSDELATPFGLAAAGQHIDVINKYGLVRLSDADREGFAERAEVIADGWGHTRDYHDWAVGLPRDRQGNYYVSLPCQQDDRTPAGARLRGTVVKLIPREGTSDNPRRFAVEQLAAGLRFPQGIALSAAGDLFVTDNQGHYTPFNELNHIVKGARYGFLNRLEVLAGLHPPYRPAAIEIPHPWTRSVNGVCFLEAPQGSNTSAEALFGPLAGQLVGCEYDTRRLVRMSLEQIEGDWQGAVYPLSVEPPAGQPTFEGPLACGVSPRGDLYIGSIRDSGWGAGSNTGSLVRLRYSGQLPPGIARVSVALEGFRVEFTQTVDRELAADASRYQLSSYRRIPTPDYGGPDLDRRTERLTAIDVSSDGRSALVHLAGLREGFVYEFHLKPLVRGQAFFPAEAYYTLRHRRS